jgi:hypothetical protein
MGMTIDEAILDLTALKICGVVPFTKGTISGGNYKVITEECLNTAINTMRKYQKIAEIYQWAKDRSYFVEADDIMDKLKEVIEDGN